MPIYPFHEKVQTEEAKRKRKIAQVWCLARDLNMDGDLLHVAVHGITGKDSIKKLTLNQLASVTKILSEKKQKDRRRQYAKNSELAAGGVHLLATPEQKELVKKLMGEIAQKRSLQYPDGYLEGICKRTFRCDYKRLNRGQMVKLIEVLKEIQGRCVDEKANKN